MILAVVGDIGLTCWVNRALAHCDQCVERRDLHADAFILPCSTYGFCLESCWFQIDMNFTHEELGANLCTLTLCWQLVYYVSVYCCQSHRRSVGIKFEPIWNSVLLPFWKSIQPSGLDHPQILSWCKKFLYIVFWLTSVKPSYSKSLSICIDFCLLQLHQLHDLMYDKSTDVKHFHFLQHPAMYACAKFVTSPAVVSKLDIRISHSDDVSTISRESKSQWRFGIPTLTAKL